MPKPYDTRLIMMVAQEKFDVESNQFCKLLPIAYVDGQLAKSDDFPNDGEIWWMLTAQSKQLAEPGRLLVGDIEDSRSGKKEDPERSQFEVRKETIQELNQKDGLAIIDIPGESLEDLQDLVSDRFRMQLPVTPPPHVLLRWRSQVVGPFAAVQEIAGDSGRQPDFRFVPARAQNMAVYQIDKERFEEEADELCLEISEDVSVTTTARGRIEPSHLKCVQYRILRWEGYERLMASNPAMVDLEPLDRKLLRFAKKCLTRSDRQKLKELLGEMNVTGPETQDPQEMVETITRVREVTQKQDEALDVVADALLKSGLLGEDRIAKAERAAGEEYVQQTTAKLQAQVEEEVAAVKEKLTEAEGAFKIMDAKLQNVEAQRREEVEEELAAEKELAKQEMAVERLELKRQKTEFQRQQDALHDNLLKVTEKYRNAGQEVVNSYLAIAPLIRLQESESTGGAPAVAKERQAALPGEEAELFSLPAFVKTPRKAPETPVPEEEFLTRFQNVVDESGFKYRPLDLKRFHLSVKCGDLTVLGGPSGTGKSSLPRLYTQALLGDQQSVPEAERRPGCLMVNVNPSWMDTRDLLGHVNTLEGRFFPAESGLYKYLLRAAGENQAHDTGTGLYPVCLDEMNLAQVEHYFSDFMVALERDGVDRAIQCFSPETVGSRCPFRQWGRVTLSPSIRFIGTVNFDETTRLLSDRFLDRVNLIRLGTSALPLADAAVGNPTVTGADGRMITLMDFQAWCDAGALPTELGALIDQLRPILSRIGCPLSPRVYRGMCRFVASAKHVLQPAIAFDVQLAQRVVPKIRPLVGSSQLDALDELLRMLKSSSICSFEETFMLLEEIRASSGSDDWNLEE